MFASRLFICPSFSQIPVDECGNAHTRMCAANDAVRYSAKIVVNAFRSEG